jgi:tRNA nucleotidyltransferase (CCA-adding enzyme)
MRRAARQPFRIYRVGGSVRDELIGRAGGDRDWVVVGATPELMTASGYKPVGNDFPVFLHPETREEYALARTERKHGRGYRGFEFFASPEVTLEDDLARRDLTINAMAVDERGRLIDPHGGQADLRAGILRHVAPAFVEDPLRVLRVARFAARLGFAVAPETRRLMRKVVASGELATLAPERVWQELARGLMEDHPSRMLGVLRGCGALAELLPEVDAMFESVPTASRRGLRPGRHLSLALDWAARHRLALPARAAALMYDFAMMKLVPGNLPGLDSKWRSRVRRVDAICVRLRAPVECRDAARLLARWQGTVERADRLAPAALLDLLQATDALRRPERLDLLCAASAAVSCSRGEGAADYAPAKVLRDALRVASKVDAGAAARAATRRPGRRDGVAIAAAVRAARLAALRAAKRRT